MIRRATIDDLEQLAEMFDGYRQFYGQCPDVESASDFLRQRLENEESVIYVAVDGDDIVGLTQLYPTFSSVSMRRVWILNDLFVLAAVRAKGIGASLLHAARAHAIETGAVRLVLATAKDNRQAQSLYRKLGWQADSFLHFELPVR